MGDKQDVKDRELTQVQIYKLFTLVQKKNNYFTNFIIFIKHLEGSRGRTLRLSYLASRARTHAKRARTRTACRQSHPRGPLTPLQTSPSPEGVLCTDIYIGYLWRDGKPSLTCQRTPSATMAPYRGAKRYLRCLFIEFEAKEKAPTSP